jgi:excisionase family DNA binding protein
MNEQQIPEIFGISRYKIRPVVDGYTVQDLCNYFRVAERTLRRWHETGFGPKRSVIDGRHIYLKSDVDAWMKSREQLGQSVYTIKEAASLLGVTDRTMRRWTKINKGPPRIMDRKMILYSQEDVHTWLEFGEFLE